MESLTIDSIEYREDAYSYRIAFLYFLANLLSAAMSTTLCSVSHTLSLLFGVSEWSIYYLNTVFTLATLFCNFPANAFIEKYGTRKSIILGVGLT
jgi:MFS family permease